MSYPQYFNYRGHRYYKTLTGLGSRKYALERAAQYRKEAVNKKIGFAVHKESDGRYSVGHWVSER